MNFLKNLLVVGSLLFAASLLLGAIETGEIQGQVVDENGDGLPGVRITAESPHLQGTRASQTNQDGKFRFPLLPVGTYTLSFRLQGFTPVVQENVVVRLGRVTDLKVTLKPSQIKEEIVVSAPSPLVDKTSSDTSYYLSSQDLEKI
ncbi:carboxypeptidase regulatory-like domain-containing protein, partial [bacterium]|nr:carboxypeptidase regulatory-like domain-containing protein [bacterium]